jgi:hypothetical protein
MVNLVPDIFEECNLENLQSFFAMCPGFQGCDADVLKQRCPKIKEILGNSTRYLWKNADSAWSRDSSW